MLISDKYKVTLNKRQTRGVAAVICRHVRGLAETGRECFATEGGREREEEELLEEKKLK